MRYIKGIPFRSKVAVYLVVLFCAAWIFSEYFAPIKFRFPAYGYASWYSKRDLGVKKRTANNEKFNDKAMTAAMWGVPFGTMLKVTNRATGKYVVVRVNDRGPHRRYVQEGRVIDLTKAAFRQISKTKHGLIPVKVEQK